MRRRWSPATKVFAVLALASGVGAYAIVTGYARRLEALRPAVGAPASVVVAAEDIDRGVTLETSMLRVAQVPSAFEPPGAFRAPEPLLGRVLLAPLTEGEPVTATRLATPNAGPVAALVPPGLRAFVVAAPLPERVVRPGDRVDVLATFGGPRTYTETVAEGIEVLSVLTGPGNTPPLSGQTSAGPGVQLVLIVAPELAERLAYASAFADLSVTVAPAPEPASIAS